SDNLIYSGPVIMDRILSRHPYLRPAGQLNLPEHKYRIFLIAPATNFFDPALQKNQMGIEVFQEGRSEALAVDVMTLNNPLTVGELEIIYADTGSFSGFIVNRDPGIGFIWTGAGLLLLGLAVVFFFPRRQLQAAWLDLPETGRGLYLVWNKAGERSGEAAMLSEYIQKARDEVMVEDSPKEG
ncbi:MAG TPA: cytochrome c biogenesis protein ResB, partial [Dehalococcoidales bacterium]|nr:cytochrome c biogenesis protein ResB [Dehalococcoidales bacterium]